MQRRVRDILGEGGEEIRELTIEEMVGEGGLSERVNGEVRRELQVFLQRTGRKI